MLFNYIITYIFSLNGEIVLFDFNLKHNKLINNNCTFAFSSF